VLYNYIYIAIVGKPGLVGAGLVGSVLVGFGRARRNVPVFLVS